MTFNDKLQLKAVQTLIFGAIGYFLRAFTFFYMESFSPSGLIYMTIGSFVNLFAIIMAIAGVVYFFKGINEKFTLGKIVSSLVVFGYIGLLIISILLTSDEF